MGMLGKLVKGGIAGAIIAQARKPQNQERAKRAFRSVKERASGSSGKGR